MDMIVTHENADFDAVASLWAAAKLFPAAVPYLPRRLNRNVQDFLALYGGALTFARFDERPPQRVARVIVVDSQSAPSLRGTSEATTWHFIDHHPFDKSLPADTTHEGAEVGATTTLLVQRLMQSPQSLDPIEATLLMLGIDEDTGALTYSHTQRADFQAAAWLFEHGANLDRVNEFLHHPLTPPQRALYETLLHAAHVVTVGGYAVVITAARSGERVEEISTLSHYLRDVFDCAALFVLVQENDHVQVVARSTSDAIDVGALMAALGGGGHARAAAALVRDTPLEQVEQQLQDLLPTHVRPMLTAAQVMARSVRTLSPEMPIREAEHLVRRYGHEGFPVVSTNGTLLGLLTRREIDRAVQHQLGDAPVAEYMHTGEVAIAPDETIERAREIMLARGLGQVPVVAQGKLVGIVTRTDLIKQWGQPAPLPTPSEVSARLEASLPDDVVILLRAAGSVAQKKQYLLYVVGGFVRDLLLGAPNDDVDLVVEGDAIALARAMEKRFGGHIHKHERFGTAKWLLAETPFTSLESIDFITARREFYTHPTALPEVERSSIQQDLHRRDFTINTLAICLDEFRFGQMLDFFGGLADLRAGTIRVLHNLSFVEDPTRILRAVRYEQRLGFQIEPRTAELIAGALDLLARVSGERIANELFLILAEQESARALQRLDALGVLCAIHPALRADANTEQQFARVRVALSAAEPIIYLGVLTASLPPATALSIAERLSLSNAQTDFIKQLNRVRALEPQLAEDALAPSVVTRLLDGASDEALQVAAALSEPEAARAHIAQYRAQWRNVKPLIGGTRLQELGIPRGPQYRKILEAIRDAQLDGTLATAAEAEQAALRLAQPEHTER